MNTNLTTVNERSSARYQFTVYDFDKVVVPKAQFSAMTLTLFDQRTGDIINSRNAVNAFDQNNVSIATDGTVTWDIQPADNQVVNSTYSQETHIAQFAIIMAGGKSHVHQTVIVVNNLAKVV